eukprot:m.238135 g.238135  ORF g.238135 m.238135 type:complete len:2022 (+) comp17425_c0_seq3:175-6240(+)
MALLALLLLLPACYTLELPLGIYETQFHHAIASQTSDLANEWLQEVPKLGMSLDQLCEDRVVEIMHNGSAVDWAALNVQPLALLYGQVAGHSAIIKPERMADKRDFLVPFSQDGDTIASQLSQQYAVPFSTHVYVSGPGRAQALRPHTDGGDVFVYQLIGRKHWTICTPPCPAGYTCDNTSNADQALMAEMAKKQFNGCTSFTTSDVAKMDCQHVELSAGDALYLPAGLVHYAETDDNTNSVHMTLRMQLPGYTAVDQLEARCLQVYPDTMCSQLRSQIEADARMFQWYRVFNTSWPELPSKLQAITSTEYGVGTLDRAAVLRLMSRRHSVPEQELIRERRSTTMAWTCSGCGCTGCSQLCDDSCDDSCDGFGGWGGNVECDDGCDASCDQVKCTTGCVCPSGWGLSGQWCNRCSSTQTYTVQNKCHSGCVAGLYLDGSDCRFCPANTYISSARHVLTSCTAMSTCSAGKYISSAGSGSQNRKCTDCPAGKFAVIENLDLCSAKRRCSPGQFASAVDDLTRDTVCNACSQGTYQDQVNHQIGTCVPQPTCANGQYVKTAATTSTRRICASCPSDTYSTSTNQLACTTKTTQCGEGSRVLDTGGTTADYTCIDCEPGSNQSLALHREPSCPACPKGTAQPATGQSTCAPCLINHYSPVAGRATCLSCASSLGFYQPQEGQSECIGCGHGRYLSSAGTCEACLAGSYQPGMVAPMCTACPAGRYSHAAAAECLACPAGSFSAASGASMCTPCPAGTYSNASQVKCAPCPALQYQPSAGQPVCLPCAGFNTVISNRTQCRDVTPPVLSSASDTVIVEEDDPNYTSPTVTAMDDIDGNVSSSIVVSDPANITVPGVYTVSYQARDAAGNVGVLSVTVRVVVGNRPVIVLQGPNPLRHEANAPFVDPLGRIDDTLQPNLTQHLQSNAASAVNVSRLGNYTVTYTMAEADRQGYTAEPVQRHAVVEDTTPPVLTPRGSARMIVEAATPWTDPGAVAIDGFDGNVSAGIKVLPAQINTMVPTGTSYTILYTAKDASGNTQSVLRKVTVVDTTPPTVTLVGNHTVSVEAGEEYIELDAMAVDTLDGVLAVSVHGNVTTSPATLPALFNITYSARDNTGNKAVATRRILVDDTQAPVLKVVSSTMVFEAGAAYMRPASWLSAHDLHQGDVSSRIESNISMLPLHPESVPSDHWVEFTASDARNNTGRLMHLVTLVDTTAPELAVKNIELQPGVGWSPAAMATAWDASEGDITDQITVASVVVKSGVIVEQPVCRFAKINNSVSRTEQEQRAVFLASLSNVSSQAISGTEFTVTLTVSDRVGLNTTRVGLVQLQDATSPVINLGSDESQVLQATSVADELPYGETTVTAQDDLDGDVSDWVCVEVVEYAPLGNYTPTATSAVGELLETVNINASLELDRRGVLAKGDYSLIKTAARIDTVYSVTYSVSDAAGNRATAVRTLRVFDTEAPELKLLPDDSGIELPFGIPFEDPLYTVSDFSEPDIGDHVLVEGVDMIDPLRPAAYTVTYTAQDRFGNRQQAQRSVRVEAFVTPDVNQMVQFEYAQGITSSPSAVEMESLLTEWLGLAHVVVVSRYASDGDRDRFNTLPSQREQSTSNEPRRRRVLAASTTTYEFSARSSSGTYDYIKAEMLLNLLLAADESRVVSAATATSSSSASSSGTNVVVYAAAGGGVLLVALVAGFWWRSKHRQLLKPDTTNSLTANPIYCPPTADQSKPWQDDTYAEPDGMYALPETDTPVMPARGWNDQLYDVGPTEAQGKGEDDYLVPTALTASNTDYNGALTQPTAASNHYEYSNVTGLPQDDTYATVDNDMVASSPGSNTPRSLSDYAVVDPSTLAKAPASTDNSTLRRNSGTVDLGSSSAAAVTSSIAVPVLTLRTEDTFDGFGEDDYAVVDLPGPAECPTSVLACTLTRQGAKALLKDCKPGAFVLRAKPGDTSLFAISLRTSKTTGHFRLQHREDGVWTVEGTALPDSVATLGDCVKYLEEKNAALQAGLPRRLRHRVTQAEMQDVGTSA